MRDVPESDVGRGFVPCGIKGTLHIKFGAIGCETTHTARNAATEREPICAISPGNVVGRDAAYGGKATASVKIDAINGQRVNAVDRSDNT